MNILEQLNDELDLLIRDNPRPEQKSGIYYIKNLANGKFYIGSSKDIKKRIYVHRKALMTNNHYNPFLQEDWNIYGENNFKFSIIEATLADEVFEREQYYLDLLKPYDRNIGYNICTEAGTTRSVKWPADKLAKRIATLENRRGKIIEVISPDGKIFTINKNIKRFANSLGLSSNGFVLMLNGTTKTCHGWHLPNQKLKTYHLVDPNGKEYIIKRLELKKFCSEKGLSYQAMFKMVSGKNKRSSGGWTIKDIIKERILILVDPQNKEYILGKRKLLSFCKKHDLNRYHIYKMINGGIDNVKGWTLKYLI